MYYCAQRKLKLKPCHTVATTRTGMPSDWSAMSKAVPACVTNHADIIEKGLDFTQRDSSLMQLQGEKLPVIVRVHT